jgi:D-glycero-D-manno-heptose 1,7-bisphosphate phosphatase
MSRPALFLDRDGVINVDHGYVHTPEEFQFIDGIFDLVSAANRSGYLVVVVTNQAGIGRGYYSEAQFHALTDWMKTKFAEHGGKIDAVYFCPHHPTEGLGIYRKDCDCRKPAPGMLLAARHDLDINLTKSIFVGDLLKDVQAADAAGIGQVFILQTDKIPSPEIANCTQILDLASVTPHLTSN